MKNFLRMFGVASLLGALLVFSGCGDDDNNNIGYVVDGPVYNATVRYVDSTGKYLQTNGTYAVTSGASDVTSKTGQNGAYIRNGLAVLVAANGTHIPTGSVAATNPAMAAPAGALNVSPVTTLVYYTPTFKTTVEKLGITYDTVYLSVPSATNAKTLMALNEGLGKLITGATTTEIATLATNLNTIFATSPLTSTTTATALATTFTTNSAAIIAGTTIAATKVTDAAAAITSVNSATSGATVSTVPTTTTTSTAAGTTTTTAAGTTTTTAAGTTTTTVATTTTTTVAGTPVAITAANVTADDATTGNKTYTLAAVNGAYTFTINGFAAGDKIVGPTGVVATLTNSSYTDGIADIRYNVSPTQDVLIRLTGLGTLDTWQLYSTSQLNVLLGAGTFQ